MSFLLQSRKRHREHATLTVDLGLLVSYSVIGCEQTKLNEWAEPQPCGCKCCHRCMIQHSWGETQFFRPKCPACLEATQSISHHALDMQETRQGDYRQKMLIIATTMAGAPNKEMDPVRWFNTQPIRYRNRHACISFVGAKNNNKNYTVTNHFEINGDFTGTNTSKFEALGAKLHTYLVGNSQLCKEEWTAPIMDSEVLFEQANQDNSVLMRFLSTFATGIPWTAMRFCQGNNKINDTNNSNTNNYADDSKHSAYSKSHMRAVYVCKNVISCLNTRKPGPFQLSLGSLLDVHAVPANLRNFFSNCRLAASIGKVSSLNMEMISSTLEKGLDLTKTIGGLLMLGFDNLGFCICGAAAGYKQFTMIMLRLITKKEVEEKGTNTKNRTNGKVWEDICDSVNIEETFLPGPGDDNIVSDRVLAVVKAVLECAPDLLSAAEARAILKDNTQARTQPVVFGVGVPAEIGEQQPVAATLEVNSVVVENEVAVEDVEEDEETPPKLTSYEVNGQVIDIPWSVDLAKKQTLKLLQDYSALLMDKAKVAAGNKWDSSILKEYGIAAQCDGSPAYGFVCLQDEYPEMYSSFKCFFGAFHMYLEFYKKKGSLLEHGHFRDVYSSWRSSNKAVEYVMTPSDPRQAELEGTEVHCATIYAAALGLQSKLYVEEVSAVEVVDHMLDRAREQPEAFSQLVDTRLTDILWMIRDSEKTGNDGCDPVLYQTAIRYASALFARTNAFKYVRLLADLAIHFHCASDCENAIWDSFVFTQIL